MERKMLKRVSLPAALLVLLGLVLSGLGLSVAGCGGGEGEQTETDRRSHTSGREETAEEANRREGVELTGLMGSIRREAVESALNPRMNRFAACFMDRANEVEYLGGSIRLAFRIDPEGVVEWVYPEETDIGDRQTERCIMEVAHSTRFRRPSGGPAEFSWGFHIDARDDIRPPLNWSEDQVSSAVSGLSGDLLSQCGGLSYRVTAYISPGGRVQAAGAAVSDQESAQHLDCIAEGVAAWTLPDPGSYAAKVTFSLQ